MPHAETPFSAPSKSDKTITARASSAPYVNALVSNISVLTSELAEVLSALKYPGTLIPARTPDAEPVSLAALLPPGISVAAV